MNTQNQEYEQFRVLSKILLTGAECDAVVNKFDKELEHILQKSYRNVKAKNIDISDIKDLKKSIIDANEMYYRFNLEYDHVDCFFAKYETGMHYQSLHFDCIAGENQRKLSFSLLLNDNFKGGDFELLEGEPLPAEKGKLLVFPSFLPHKVTPVTSQTRYVIFGWFYGPNFI